MTEVHVLENPLTLCSDTRLADRKSGLDLLPPSLTQNNKISATFQDQIFRDLKRSPTIDTGVDALAKVREDLGEAQRSKGQMQLQMQNLTEETQRLRMQSKLDRKRISELTVERTNLVTRMSDRDEELKGKAKLLEVSLHVLFCYILILQVFNTS